MVRTLVLLLVIAFVPCVADAQTWDITGTTGLFAGYVARDPGAGYQETWFQSVQGGIILGRYFTPHLKVELEVATTTGGTRFRERQVVVPGAPYPFSTGSEVTTSVRSLGAALTWQFRRNEWVHPFIRAGLSTDFDRVSVRTWEQFYSDGRTATAPVRVVEERVDGPHTTRAVRPVLGGGAKVYFSEIAFFRGEGQWSFHRDRHNITARAGFGIDF